MTIPLYFVGLYFLIIALASFASGGFLALPAILAVYFLANPWLSAKITEPLPWHMTFMGIDLLLMFYCMSFNTAAMNVAALMFMCGALICLFPAMGLQFVDRMYSWLALVVVAGVTFSASAHMMIEGAK